MTMIPHMCTTIYYIYVYEYVPNLRISKWMAKYKGYASTLTSYNARIQWPIWWVGQGGHGPPKNLGFTK